MYLVCVPNAYPMKFYLQDNIYSPPAIGWPNKPKFCDKGAHLGAKLNLCIEAPPFQAQFLPCRVAQGRTGLEGLILGGLNLRGANFEKLSGVSFLLWHL